MEQVIDISYTVLLPNLVVKFDMPFTPVGDKRKGRDLERENQVFY